MHKKSEGDRLKLSTKGRYGLRALIDLAQYSEEEPVSITSISNRQGISERYLEQLMAKLKKAEIVKSIRGAGFLAHLTYHKLLSPLRVNE